MTKTSIEEIKSAQDQPFTCASFSGGGAKGAIYSGAHEALNKAGILKNLKAVAGSSAGSITAAMIATGISSEKFQKISQDTNLKGLLGEGGIINKDGKPLLELMRNTIRSNISDFLENVDVLDLSKKRLDEISKKKEQLGNLPEKERQETLAELLKQEKILNGFISSGGAEINEIKKKSLDSSSKILFKDVAMLRVLAPETFKDLVITATNRTTGDLTIFSTENTPDVEIALACRASASIPLVFEPVTINGQEYVDGGYRDNLPLNSFDHQKTEESKEISNSPEEIQKAKKQGRTLALAFGSGMEAEANVAIYSAKEKIVDPSRLVKFLMDVVFKALNKVGGKFVYSEEENKLHERIRENALNTVVLDTKEISALSFDLAQERAEYLHIKGFMQTARYFDNHDVAPITDPNFEMKDFMLKVYEDSMTRSTFEGWKDKIVGGKNEKLKDMLEFCKDDIWVNKAPQEVLSDFVFTCSKARTSGQNMTNTRTMGKLVNALNDPYTPEIVREQFLTALNIDMTKDIRLDQNKDFSQNLAKFKFEENDFKVFVQGKDQEKPKSMSEKYIKEKSSSKDDLLKAGKKNDIKDIIEKGKSDSATEKIKSESLNPEQRKGR